MDENVIPSGTVNNQVRSWESCSKNSHCHFKCRKHFKQHITNGKSTNSQMLHTKMPN